MEKIPNLMHAAYFVHLCLIKKNPNNFKTALSWFGWKYVD